MLSIGREKWSQLVSGENLMKKSSYFREMRTSVCWIHLLKRQVATFLFIFLTISFFCPLCLIPAASLFISKVKRLF